jgi:transketolase N-terminal domain/subunit
MYVFRLYLFFKVLFKSLLDAAWAQAGFIEKEELLNIRKHTSDLEGHPTPRLAFVDVATGSLGQVPSQIYL